jgi:Ca2+-binding EF-hand superfamily protein
VNFKKVCLVLSKSFQLTKKDDKKDLLVEFSNSLDKIKGLPKYTYSEGLQNAAEITLKSIISNNGKLEIPDEETLKKQVKSTTKSAENLLISADLGNTEYIVGRLYVDDLDPERKTLKAICSNTHRYIGVASATFNDDSINVVILANGVNELPKNYGEDQPLKEAFDIFDVFQIGKLDADALKEAFLALGLDYNSYSVYRAIDNLTKNPKVIKEKGVDFDTFRETIKSLIGDFESKDGIRKLFDVFVDDPQQDIITASTLRRVAKEVKDDIAYKDIIDIFKRVADNGRDLNFEEFYNLMMQWKETHPDNDQEVGNNENIYGIEASIVR